MIAATFNADRTQLAAVSEKEGLRVWAVSPLEKLHHHQMKAEYIENIRSLAFSTNSKRLLAGTRDNKYFVLDANSGQELRVLKGTSAVFTSDSSAVIAHWRGAIQRLPIFDDASMSIAEAKKAAVRCISPAERQIYFPSRSDGPPDWCIMGADPTTLDSGAKLNPKWPYRTDRWKDWYLSERKENRHKPLPATN